MGKTKKEDFQVNETQLNEGIIECIKNVNRLCRTALIILESEKNIFHALGLYTYAIEEYGKALYLKEILSEKKDQYLIEAEKKFKDHRFKFSKAWEKLPENCKFYESNLSSNDPEFADEYYYNNIKPKLPHGMYPFLSTAIQHHVDFPARLECFFVDWDYEKKSWKKFPKQDKNRLRQTIEHFIQYLQKEFNL